MMKKSTVYFTLTAILAQFTASAQQAAPAVPSPDAVLAKINTRTISLKEFNSRYAQNSQLVPGRAPDKKEVLKNIVYFELATQEAKKINLANDPSLKEQFDILLYQALVRKMIQPKIDSLDVGESDVKKYYDENPLLRTSHIILLSKPGMSEKELAELKSRANKVADLVKKGEKSFEDLAKEYSEGPSARTGGDVDWGARHKLLPEYYNASLALKNLGDTSGVVETPYGYSVIKLTGRKPYSEIDPVYKDFIVRSLKESKGQEIYNAYFEDLKKRYRVVINEDLIK